MNYFSCFAVNCNLACGHPYIVAVALAGVVFANYSWQYHDSTHAVHWLTAGDALAPAPLAVALASGHGAEGEAAVAAAGQGLTIVHLSAQRRHFLWTTDVHFSA
jgi:hypothetical protein